MNEFPPSEVTTGTAHAIPEPPTDEERMATIIGNVFEAKFAAAFEAKFGPLAALMSTVLDTLMQVCAAQQTQEARQKKLEDENAALRVRMTAAESRLDALEGHHATCRSHP